VPNPGPRTAFLLPELGRKEQFHVVHGSPEAHRHDGRPGRYGAILTVMAQRSALQTVACLSLPNDSAAS
jgi:hypothetical protein